MPIYLKHERHGTKVATSEAEAVYDESHGWTRYDVATPPATDDRDDLIPAFSLEEGRDEAATNVTRIKRPYKRRAA